MDEILQQSLLYDFYGELLNENQKKIYEMYVFENLSLAEIAEARGISRQGVFETFKRCSGILEHYEEKLHMVAQYRMLEDKLSELKRTLQAYRKDKDEARLSFVESEIDRICNEL